MVFLNAFFTVTETLLYLIQKGFPDLTPYLGPKLLLEIHDGII